MAQQVTRVPSGVVLAAEEPIYTIAGRATVYVPLANNNRRQVREWRQALVPIADALQAVETTFANATRNMIYGQKLMTRHYQRALKDLREAFPLPASVTPTRKKRGLFNFIGDIASSLFGTPSASDFEALKFAQSALGETVDAVIKTQTSVIGVVNTLNANQKKITDSVNDVTQRVNFMLGHLETLRQENSQRMAVEDVVTELLSFRTDLARYVTWMDRMTAMRAACESDSQSELIIPTALLKEITGQDDPRSYYQYLHTDKIIEVNNTLYCVVNVPLFRPNQDRLYAIETYPVCDGNCHRIYHHDKLVLDPLSETIYFPEECVGYNPIACRPGVEFPASTQPCLHGLINGDATLQAQCPLTIYRDHPLPIPGRLPKENQFAVATPTTTYRYLCPNSRPKTGQLESGVYLVTIDSGCNLDANLWRLSGEVHRTYYATMPASEPRPVNVTINIPTTELVLPKHLSVLEIAEVQKLSQPDSPHIAASIFNLHARIASSQDFWQWVLLTLLLIAIFIYVYRKYRSKLSCSFPNFHKKPIETTPPNDDNENPVHYVASTPTDRLYPELPTAPQDTHNSTQTNPIDFVE